MPRGCSRGGRRSRRRAGQSRAASPSARGRSSCLRGEPRSRRQRTSASTFRGADLVLTSLLYSDAMLAHDTVSGAAVEHVALASRSGTSAEVAWAELSAPKTPGVYTVSFRARGEAVEIPHCNGRQKISIDDTVRDPGSKGPLVVRLEGDSAHEVKIEIKASTYEKRIACSGPPRVGVALRSSDGLVRIEFASPSTAK